MRHQSLHWDEREETGLRLCTEYSTPSCDSRLPRDVSACCWYLPSPAEKVKVGLCGSDGSFVIVPLDDAGNTATGQEHVYAVYFSTVPVHLWACRDTRDNIRQFLPASNPARRICQAWSQVTFVPGHEGEVLFVQGWSSRVLWTKLPNVEQCLEVERLLDVCERHTRLVRVHQVNGDEDQRCSSSLGRFGFVDGSRVVAFDEHEAQVRCLSLDEAGILLLTGDDSGVLCVRELPRERSINSPGTMLERPKDSAPGRSPVDDHTVIVTGAHDGGVYAVSHVMGSQRRLGLRGGKNVDALFLSGGAGGVARLWRATSVSVKSETDGRGMESTASKLRVELLADMLVGGFQVSSLASSLLHKTPLVFAGTKEGTVFGFELDLSTIHERVDRALGGSDSVSNVIKRSVFSNDRNIGGQDASETARLGRVLMKFEHTSRGIKNITCSREQELIATADAEGIVRTYRPLPSQDAGLALSISDSQDIGSTTVMPWQLVVECRLGSATVLCEFAMENTLSTPDDRQAQVDTVGYHQNGVASHSGPKPLAGLSSWAADSKEDSRRVGWKREREVLRACARDGRLRVWPVAALPVRPMRPVSAQLSSSPQKLSNNQRRSQPASQPVATSEHGRCVGLNDAGSYNNAPKGDTFEGATSERTRHDASVVARPSSNDDYAREGKVENEEFTARNGAPIPSVRPTQPRRVSFAVAEQVYDLPDDDNQSTNSSSNHGSICKEDEDEEEIEVPHPSPPPPTPAISPAHPRQPRQTRRGPASRVNRDRAAQAASEGEHHKYFVTPSSLQEPSLCSTVLEQAALERCMKEEFDVSTAREPPIRASRAAASSAVNIHPHVRTFEGLVPVSLDAPPLRPRNRGKQVSKAHLSKVEERRITEEDLLFEDMEPVLSTSSLSGLEASRPLWPQVDPPWYGNMRTTPDLEDSSQIARRVWSWGLKP